MEFESFDARLSYPNRDANAKGGICHIMEWRPVAFVQKPVELYLQPQTHTNLERPAVTRLACRELCRTALVVLAWGGSPAVARPSSPKST